MLLARLVSLGFLGAFLGCGGASSQELDSRAASQGGAGGLSGSSGQAGASGEAGAGAGGAGMGGAGAAGVGGIGGPGGVGGEAGGAGEGGASGGGAGQAGAGTSGQGGEAGQGGAGGTGGAGMGGAVACGLLQPAGPPVEIVPGENQALRFPRVASVDAATVALGAGIELAGSPGSTVPIGWALAQPWASWPIVAPPLGQITFGGGSAFELAGGEGQLWLLSATGAEVGGAGLTLLPLLGQGSSPDLVVVDTLSTRPLFLTRAGSSLLSAGQQGDTIRGFHTSGETTEALEPTLSCGLPLRAGAVPMPGGGELWLGVSRGSAGACGPGEGPSNRLVLWRREGSKLVPVHEREPETSLEFAALLPRSDGAWLLTQQGDSLTAGPLVAERLDAAGIPTGKTFEVLGSGQLFSRPSLAAVGDRIAVLWVDMLGQVDKLLLKVADEATSTPPLLISNDFSTERRLVGSPDGSKVLLAWDGGGPSSPLRLLRVDCAADAL